MFAFAVQRYLSTRSLMICLVFLAILDASARDGGSLHHDGRSGFTTRSGHWGDAQVAKAWLLMKRDA